jgi:hypothetical protein
MMQKINESELCGLLKLLKLEKEIFRVNLEFEDFGPNKRDYGSVKFNGKQRTGRFRKIGVTAKYNVKKTSDGVFFVIEITKMFQFTEAPTEWAHVSWETSGKLNFV